MDDLRRRLAALDRIAVPDHWPEIERRAWSAARHLPPEPSRTSAAPATEVGPAVTTRTRWIGSGRQPGRRSPVLTPIRVLAVGLVAALSTGLLAVSLSSAPSPPTGFGAPGASSSPVAEAASPDELAAEPAGEPIAWDTGCVQLTADWLRIQPDAATDEPDRIFTADGVAVSLHSDPGRDTYRTLEAEWLEDSSEMRLNFYFEADDDSWRVRELRTYDGQPVPDWITYPGPLFETPLGETFAGDVLLDSSLIDGASGNVPGTIEMRGLVLSVPAFGPGTAPAACVPWESSNSTVSAESSADVAVAVSPSPTSD